MIIAEAVLVGCYFLVRWFLEDPEFVEFLLLIGKHLREALI